MVDMKTKIEAALVTAMNNGIEAAATVAESLGDREIAGAIRLLKRSTHESLEDAEATPPGQGRPLTWPFGRRP